MAQPTGRVTPSWIAERARARGLDPQAVLAVAGQEGLGGGVGDAGTSFGPFQLHYGGAYPSSAPHGAQASQEWAWSPQGVDYALEQQAKYASGLRGPKAVNAIVRQFERPANPDAEVSGALGAYGAPAAPAPTSSRWPGLAEAFYDPLGSFDNGQFGGPIGGHSDHVHVSDTDPQGVLSAIRLAQQLGLHVGENPYVGNVAPVHVKGSYHYRDFPGQYDGKTLGEALDVSGSPELMAQYYRTITGGLAAPAAPPMPAAPVAGPPQQNAAVPDTRREFASALLAGISPTGQLSQQGLVQALMQRPRMIWS